MWIKCSEKMPDAKTYNLIIENGRIHLAFLTNDGFFELEKSPIFYTHLEITHWMPLPEPPILV